MADIPRYHSYLDYYRPPSRAPGADVWGAINRGVQGALSGYMKYQQEKEYNNFQGFQAEVLKGFDRTKSQEEFAKYATDLESKFKLSKDYKNKGGMFVGQLMKQLMPQKQLDAYISQQEGIAKQKKTDRRTKLMKNMTSELSKRSIADAARYSSENIGRGRKFGNITDFVHAMPDVSNEVANNVLNSPDVLKKFESMNLTPEEYKGIQRVVSDNVIKDFGRTYSKLFAEINRENQREKVLAKKIERENTTYTGIKNKYYANIAGEGIILKDLCKPGYVYYADRDKLKAKITKKVARIVGSTYLMLSNARREDVEDIYGIHFDAIKPYLNKEMKKDENKEIVNKLMSGELKKKIAELPNQESHKSNVASIKKALGKDWNRLVNFLSEVTNRNGSLNKAFSDDFAIFIVESLGR